MKRIFRTVILGCLVLGTALVIVGLGKRINMTSSAPSAVTPPACLEIDSSHFDARLGPYRKRLLRTIGALLRSRTDWPDYSLVIRIDASGVVQAIEKVDRETVSQSGYLDRAGTGRSLAAESESGKQGSLAKERRRWVVIRRIMDERFEALPDWVAEEHVDFLIHPQELIRFASQPGNPTCTSTEGL